MIPALALIIGAYVIFRALEIGIRSNKQIGGWGAVVIGLCAIILGIVVLVSLGDVMRAGQAVSEGLQPLQP